MFLHHCYFYFLFILSLLCPDCSWIRKPGAKLEFSSISRAENGYAITFHSDRDMEAPFAENPLYSIVTRKLVCALTDDNDFRVEHHMAESFRGTFALVEKEGPLRHRYVATGDFDLTWDKGSSTRFLEKYEVVNLLSKRTEVECKALMTVYFSRPYYSETMRVPASAFVRFLEQEPLLPP